MQKEAQGTNKVVEGSNVYDWPCFLFANTITVLTVDFEMAFWSVRPGQNQLFSYFHSIMRFKENPLPDT